MTLNITCIPGDGIGPEIVGQAKRVLEKVAEVYGHEMKFTDHGYFNGRRIHRCLRRAADR